MTVLGHRKGRAEIRPKCWQVAGCALLLALVTAPAIPAAIVSYNQSSDPVGIISQSAMVETPTNVTTMLAPQESSLYAFTHWTVNGFRSNDFLGRALNPVSFTIYEPTEAVAHYLPSATDSDVDGVPDWFEVLIYGTTSYEGSSDTDSDGYALQQEFLRDYPPSISNGTTLGGVSTRDSVLLRLIISSNFFVYNEQSSPLGLVERELIVSNGTIVTTACLYGESIGYTFACWLLDGVRQQDISGYALAQVTVFVTGTTVATANYVASSADADVDGIPDWYEWQVYGFLTNGAASDTDADGYNLQAEYLNDYSPLVVNSSRVGGVSARDSVLTEVNLTDWAHYEICSDPAGLITPQNGLVRTGTVVTTASLHGDVSGYAFGYWMVNGARQGDIFGCALASASFTVFSDTVAIAQYFPGGQDSDGDDIPDWYEWQVYGTLDNSAAYDGDHDGYTLSRELLFDYSPLVSNFNRFGGVSARDSSLTTLDMQMFERLKYALVDGVITQFFTLWPTNVTGFDAGLNSAVGTGDWDGDGDLDVFVGASGGVLRIYENIGSKYGLNWSEETAAFSSLASAWNGIPNPAPALGDWNGDNVSELVVGGDNGKVVVFSSTTNFAGFQDPSVNYALNILNATSVIPALAEETGDDRVDLLVLLDNGTVRVYPNTGSPTAPFNESIYTNDLLKTPVPNGTGISAAHSAGFRNIGALASDSEGRVWEFAQDTNAGFVLQSKVWAGTGKGFAERLAIAVDDLDGDGDIDALCGFSGGGLMCLQDPRMGVPSCVLAYGGASSILLKWDPSRHYRIKGYYVYRGTSASGPFNRLTINPFLVPEYQDGGVTQGVTYFYYITAVSMAFYPGNSSGILVESPRSEIVSATAGSITIWMPDYSAQTGHQAVLQINLDHATGISGQGLDIRVTYHTPMLKPASQVSTNITVRKTPLSVGLSVADNAAVANGELRITGSSGTVVGNGHLFDVHFIVDSNAVPSRISTNAFSFVALQNQDGLPLSVDYTDSALFTVAGTTNCYFLGDINGDCELTMDDHNQLMFLLKKDSRPPAPQELAAGDVNGDGELTQKDIPLLLKLIHGN